MLLARGELDDGVARRVEGAVPCARPRSDTNAARSSRISPLRPHGRRSRRKAPGRACRDSAPGSRRSSSERVLPRALAHGPHLEAPAKTGPRTARKAFRSPCGVEFPLGSAPRLPAGYRRRCRPLGRGVLSTRRAKSRLRGVRPFGVPVSLTRHPASALGVPPPVWCAPSAFRLA